MTTPDRTSSTPDGPPAGPPGFWDAVFLREPVEGPVEFPPIAEDPPAEIIAPGAFRDLPAGPVPLRWGTEIDGPIIGYVTLSRLDDGTLLVSAADRPKDPDDDLVGDHGGLT